MTGDQIRIKTYLGNDLYYPVNVKRFGIRGSADVSGAAQIQIEWENEDHEHQPLITVADTLPGADWANGDVALPILSSNFTAAMGTYTFSLTIQIDGQVITTDIGTVEVRERPGYPSA